MILNKQIIKKAITLLESKGYKVVKKNNLINHLDLLKESKESEKQELINISEEILNNDRFKLLSKMHSQQSNEVIKRMIMDRLDKAEKISKDYKYIIVRILNNMPNTIDVVNYLYQCAKKNPML